MKLNLGCGKTKLDGCINIDVEATCEPDLVLDFVSSPLPYEDNSVERVYLFHVIEHIPEKRHHDILSEIRRVLSPEGIFYCAYPEFKICSQNYLSNYQGRKEFWKATIFGLQRYQSDFHVALMDSDVFRKTLELVGFEVIDISPESPAILEGHNTVVKAKKAEPMLNYEDVIKKEIFG